MSRKDLSVTIRNLTIDQYDFLEEESKKTGLSLSAIFKVWVNNQIDKGCK